MADESKPDGEVNRRQLVVMGLLGVGALVALSGSSSAEPDNGSGNGDENGDGNGDTQKPTDGSLVIDTPGAGGTQYLFIADTVEPITTPESSDEMIQTADGVEVRGGAGFEETTDEWAVTGLKHLEDAGGEEAARFILDGVELNPADYTLDPPDDGGGTTDPVDENALVRNSLDTEAHIKAPMGGFWHEAHPGHATDQKVTAVTSPAFEGAGAMRIDQPDSSTGSSSYGNANNFYGTETHHYTCRNPGRHDSNGPQGYTWPYNDVYPEDGLSEIHIRYNLMLDENYDYEDFRWRQIGKGFPGINGRWGDDAQDNRNPWLINGAIYTGDEIGQSQNEWILSAYLYDRKTSIGNSGRTYHPDMTMRRGQWYQIDRYVDVQNNVFKQWQDGRLSISLDSGDLDFPTTAPHNKVYSVRNLFYAGGGWGTPDGSGHNYAYIDDIEVFDSEQPM